MYSLESPHRGDSNEYTKHTIVVKEIKKNPKLSLFASWPGTMINPQWLELPMSRTIFYIWSQRCSSHWSSTVLGTFLYVTFAYFKILGISPVRNAQLNRQVEETKVLLLFWCWHRQVLHIYPLVITLIIKIFKICLFKYIENFTTKNWKFSDKNSDIFHISAQNIDCGYLLEPSCWGGSNEYP